MANYTYTWAKKHFSSLLGKGVVVPHQSITWTFGDVEVAVRYGKNRSWRMYVQLTEETDSSCGKYRQAVEFEGFYAYHFGYTIYKGHEMLFGAMFKYLGEEKLEQLSMSGEWEMALLIAKGQNII